MLTVVYQDGHMETYKVPLPDTLGNVQRGDNVVVQKMPEPPPSEKGT